MNKTAGDQRRTRNVQEPKYVNCVHNSTDEETERWLQGDLEHHRSRLPHVFRLQTWVTEKPFNKEPRIFCSVGGNVCSASDALFGRWMCEKV